jgi:O-antigen ligase
LLVLKRGSLLIIVIGYLVFLNFSNTKFKLNIIKIASIVALILLFTYPIYKNILLSRLETRESRLTTESYQTEGRYLENELVINDIFYSGNVEWFLFGHEIFNSPGNYGNGAFGGRQLHNDYAQVLSGSGTIGLFLYLLVNFSILYYYLKAKKRMIRIKQYQSKERLLNSLFWSFFITFFFLGLSGSITSILYNVIRYVILGSIIGIFIHKKHEQN